MTIDKRTVNLQIQGGVNERVDPRVAISPIAITNGRYTKSGTISKRIGTQCIAPYNTRYNASVAPTTTPPTPQVLTTRIDELIRIGSGELDSVSAAFTAQDAVFRGKVPSCVLRKIGRIGGVSRPGDSVTVTPLTGPHAGRVLIFTAYPIVTSNSPATTIYIDVEDYATGTVILSRVSVVSGTTVGSTVKLAQSLAAVMVVYVEGTNLKYKYVDLTTALALSSATTITTCVSATPRVDAAATTGGTLTDWVLYTIVVGNAGADYKVSYNTSGGSSATTAVTLNAITTVAIRADYLDTYYYVLVGDNNSGTHTIYGRLFTPASATAAAVAFTIKTYTAAPSTMQSAIARYSNTIHVYSWTDNDTKTFFWDKRNDAGTAQFADTTRQIGLGASATTLSATALAVQPFMVGTKMYAGLMTVQFASSTSVNLGTFNLVDLYAESDSATNITGRFEASALVQQGYRIDVSDGCVPKSMSLGGSAYAFNTCLADLNAASSASDLIRLAADFSWLPTQAATANNNATIAGGSPVSYDGSVPVSFGFRQTPTLAYTTSSTNGSLTLLATYAYVAVYEWSDANGNTHRSPVSDALVHAMTGSNNDVTLTVTTLNATNKKAAISGVAINPVYIALYRTLANGTTFYLQGRYVSAINSAAVSIVDTTSDSSLQTRPLLYTTGNVLESQSPPSAGFIFRALDRIWLVDTDDGSVWFSDTIVAGEAPRFNILWTIPAPRDGRYIAGAQLDNNVYLFTRDAIDVVFGDGPDSTGVGAFTRYRMASDVGCNESRSLSIANPYGLFFQGRNNINLLDRSQQVHRFGIAVEDSVGATQSTPLAIVAAVNVPSRSEVRFPVDVTSTQRAAVFDIVEAADLQDPDAIRRVWYVDEYTDPVGGTPKIVSGCLWNGQFTWINSAGRVFQDLPSTYLDTATGYTSQWVTLTVQTAHWNSQGLGSWMSVFGAGVLLEYLTDHGLTVSVYEDWATSSPQTGTWTRAEIATALSGTREQLIVQTAQQKCQAVSIKIVDATPTTGTVGTGHGFRLTGITLEVGAREGLVRLPAAARK